MESNIVFVKRLGGVGIYFMATLVKKRYSTNPTSVNMIMFSTSISFRPIFSPHSSFTTSKMDRITASNSKIVNTAENLTTVLCSIT